MSDNCAIVRQVQSQIPRDATAADRALWSDRSLLEWIADRQEEFMAAIDDLRSEVSALQAAVSAENTELGTIVTSLQQAEGQITQLQTQIQQGGGVTAADLEAVTSTLADIAKSAQDATSAAGGASSPAPGGAPAPTGGAPAPTGGAPAPTGGAPAVSRAEYVFDGDPSTVDTTIWPPSGQQTMDNPPRPLFFYSGDQASGDHNGDGVAGLWHLWDGPSQPAPAAGGAPEA